MQPTVYNITIRLFVRYLKLALFIQKKTLLEVGDVMQKLKVLSSEVFSYIQLYFYYVVVVVVVALVVVVVLVVATYF